MQGQTTSGQKGLVEFYEINPDYLPLFQATLNAGLLDGYATMQNWDRFAQSYGYENTEKLLGSMPVDEAKEFRLVITKTISEGIVEKRTAEEQEKIMKISRELQGIVDNKLPGYTEIKRP